MTKIVRALGNDRANLISRMGHTNPRRLEIRNDHSELRRMSAWLRQCCAELDLPAAPLFDLDVCANEAVTNIIDHAYPDDDCHHIDLLLSYDHDSLSLRIRDDGDPFNPLETDTRENPASLAEANIGGLGIQLIRSLMGDCCYVRRGGKNILTLSVHVPPKVAEQI